MLLVEFRKLANAFKFIPNKLFREVYTYLQIILTSLKERVFVKASFKRHIMLDSGKRIFKFSQL